MLTRLLALVVAGAVALLPLVPRVHLHETTDDHGHHAAIAHRHAEAHHHHDGDDARHGVRELEDDDSVVATLEPGLARTSGYALDAPEPALAALLNEPLGITQAVRAGFVERFNHGPPRAPTPVRGPPVTHS